MIEAGIEYTEKDSINPEGKTGQYEERCRHHALIYKEAVEIVDLRQGVRTFRLTERIVNVDEPLSSSSLSNSGTSAKNKMGSGRDNSSMGMRWLGSDGSPGENYMTG